MNIFPNWHDALHVPTVGDEPRIPTGGVITLDASAVRAQTFRVSVQPRTPTGSLSEHARALGALLQSAHTDTALFLDRYLRPNIASEELDRLRVALKNLLENHRSALEYTAHHLADWSTPKPSPKKVQFPVAGSKDTAAAFAVKLDNWFPGLGTSAPKAKDYLVSIQWFSGDPWLRQLADLTNFNKHRSLSAQEPGNFESVVVRFGNAGIRLGELGFRSFTLEPGAILRFVDTTGQQVDLDVPGVLDATTTSIPGADPRFEVVREARELCRIPGNNESIAGTVWSISKNVFQTVDRICSLLS